jgi:hypothetical protein
MWAEQITPLTVLNKYSRNFFGGNKSATLPVGNEAPLDPINQICRIQRYSTHVISPLIEKKVTPAALAWLTYSKSNERLQRTLRMSRETESQQTEEAGHQTLLNRGTFKALSLPGTRTPSSINF